MHLGKALGYDVANAAASVLPARDSPPVHLLLGALRQEYEFAPSILGLSWFVYKHQTPQISTQQRDEIGVIQGAFQKSDIAYHTLLDSGSAHYLAGSDGLLLAA